MFPSPSALADALAQVGYLPDTGLATAAYLAISMRRPLYLEGDAGVGKTSLAAALAEITGSKFVRLQCYEGIERSQALYDWNFPRQVLRLRQHTQDLRIAADSPAAQDDEQNIESLYTREFLVARPILQAIEQSPSVLLIDEIDRADEEFEAFLLEVLSEGSVTIPELGTVTTASPPVVVLTSNRTREVHDALKRRCLYHWVAHPTPEREVEILRKRLPEVSEALTRDVAAAMADIRMLGLVKPPGVAEAVDWARALHLLGATRLDHERATRALGAAIKYREDAEHVLATLFTER